MPVHLWKKLRDKTHGEGKGPLIVVYTPKEPEMIIRCSFVFMTYLSITTHISLRATDEPLAFRHLAGF